MKVRQERSHEDESEARKNTMREKEWIINKSIINQEKDVKMWKDKDKRMETI